MAGIEKVTKTLVKTESICTPLNAKSPWLTSSMPDLEPSSHTTNANVKTGHSFFSEAVRPQQTGRSCRIILKIKPEICNRIRMDRRAF